MRTLKWEVRQRLTLLESTVVWEGRLTSKVLIESFGISRPQATKDLTLYQELCPNNLYYDRQLKGYFATESFQPRFIKGTPDEYLALLAAAQQDSDSGPVITLASQLPTVTVLRPPQRALDFNTLHAVNRAIRQGLSLKTEYQSLSSPGPKEIRIAPHTLVFNGYRWHVRAYSETHGEYRDFLLSRMRRTPQLLGKTEMGEAQDREWNRFVSLRLAANPSLSAGQRQVIEEDFGMVDGALSVKLRAPLLDYYLRLLQIDPGSTDLANSHLQVINPL